MRFVEESEEQQEEDEAIGFWYFGLGKERKTGIGILISSFW